MFKCYQGFHTEVFVREGKEQMMQSILLLGRSGCMLPQEMFYFRLCEVTSGGLWGPKGLQLRCCCVLKYGLKCCKAYCSWGGLVVCSPRKCSTLGYVRLLLVAYGVPKGLQLRCSCVLKFGLKSRGGTPVRSGGYPQFPLLYDTLKIYYSCLLMA